MSNFNKMLLARTDDLSSSTTTWGNQTFYSSTFDSTETSMYTAIVGLASTTLYGGASLGNQTERYLVAFTDFDSATSTYNPYIHGRLPTPAISVESFLSNTLSAYTFSGGITFSAIQTSLEDDGKHFDNGTYSGNNEIQYMLVVDKNNLTSGSSGSAATSLTSWAYSSQSATDPDILIDWTTPTPDFSITEDTTDWKADILTKVTAKGLNIDSLVADYLFEQSIRDINTKLSFKDYVISKIN